MAVLNNNGARPRRTYLCGPCKRFKMKCNLELPCRLCIQTHREDSCHANPPNPPLEAEKMSIAQRRNRNLKSRRKAQAAASTDPKAPLAAPVIDLCEHSPAAPLLVRAKFFAEKQPAFLLEDLEEGSKCSLTVAASLAKETVLLLQAVKLRDLEAIYEHFSSCMAGGLLTLVSFPVLHGVIYNCTKLVIGPKDPLYTKSLVRMLCLALVALALEFIMKDNPARAKECLDLSAALMDQPGLPTTTAEFVHRGCWILMNKTPLLLINQSPTITLQFEEYMSLVAKNKYMQSLLLVDPAKYMSPEVVAMARVWLLVKILETDISVLGSQGSLQVKFTQLNDTVLPNQIVVAKAFGYDTRLKWVPSTLLLEAVLSLSLLFFRKFEEEISVRDLIRRYLTLFLDIAAKAAPLRAQLSMEEIAAVPDLSPYVGGIYSMIWLTYLETRWLTVVKIEQPYFPTLRFAHFVTALMTVFNRVQELDDRHHDNSGALFETLMRLNKSMVFKQVYLQLCNHALFITVFNLFRAPNLIVDIDFLCDTIYRTLVIVLAKVRHIEPYCLIPAIKDTIMATDLLFTFVASLEARDNPEQFILELQQHIGSGWQLFVEFTCGSDAMLASHVGQLWRMASYLRDNGMTPLYIAAGMPLNTDFFRKYETAWDPFTYPRDTVDAYLRDTVDPNLE